MCQLGPTFPWAPPQMPPQMSKCSQGLKIQLIQKDYPNEEDKDNKDNEG